MAKCSLLLILTVLLACDHQSLSAHDLKVVGTNAQQTEPGGWPSAVAITQFGRVHCTGTLVTPQLVITAAHCLEEGSDWSQTLAVYVGDGRDGGRVEAQYRVARAGRHPEYGDGNIWGWADIAWLWLAEPIENVALTSIATDIGELRELLAPGQSATIVGFGIFDHANRRLGLKHEAVAPIRYRTAQEVFLGDSQGDACGGDSGGPIFGRLQSGQWRVLGVTSRGPSQCGHDSYPGAWGIIAPHICWLEQSSGITLTGDACNHHEIIKADDQDVFALCQGQGSYDAQHTVRVLRDLAAYSLRRVTVTCEEMLAWAMSQVKLDLRYSMVRDIKPLIQLQQLESLDLEDNNIRDVAPLTKLPKLKHLRVGWNEIEDSNIFSALENKGVRVRGKALQAKRWSPQARTDFLQVCLMAEQGDLPISTQQAARAIRRAACLGDDCTCHTANSDLQRTREINLSDSDIEEVTLLRGMENLQFINLPHASLTDLEVLRSLENLRRVNVQQEKITFASDL